MQSIKETRLRLRTPGGELHKLLRGVDHNSCVRGKRFFSGQGM